MLYKYVEPFRHSRWWYKQSNVNDSSYSEMQNAMEPELVIPSVNVNNSGWYKCVAENQGGSGMDVMHISVISKSLSFE